MLSDHKILDGIRNGDNDVISLVYQMFRPRILAHVGSYGGSEQEAEDIFQEGIIAVFINAHKPDFQLTSAFYTFLHSICHKLWLKKYREKMRGGGVSLASPEVLTISPEVAQDLAYAERQQLMMEKFKALGEGCQELLNLSVLEEKKPQEIIEILGFGSLAYYYKRKSKCKEMLTELVRNDSRFGEL